MPTIFFWGSFDIESAVNTPHKKSSEAYIKRTLGSIKER